uniref:Uncharacterized protein n=1 Tax=Anguilla anguilla TaxID=7936 RepID=A0A0E9PX27_ANGAN
MVRFKGMVLNQKTRLVFFYYFSNKNTKIAQCALWQEEFNLSLN